MNRNGFYFYTIGRLYYEKTRWFSIDRFPWVISLSFDLSVLVKIHRVASISATDTLRLFLYLGTPVPYLGVANFFRL